MPRGGKREGAGGKPKWKHGKTKTIRVPEELADQVLALARELDDNGFLEPDTHSKTLDLSGVSTFVSGGKIAVYLSDLVLKGYEIRPLKLAEKIVSEVYKKQVSQGYF